jgi:hypothetical protein
MSGWVYLIQAGEYTKIGIARNVRVRLATLQTGQPIRLVLRGAVELEDYTGAEAELHEMFSAQRVHGEWFALTDLDVIEIVEWLESKPKPEVISAPEPEPEIVVWPMTELDSDSELEFEAEVVAKPIPASARIWRVEKTGGGKYWQWRKGSWRARESRYGGKFPAVVHPDSLTPQPSTP